MLQAGISLYQKLIDVKQTLIKISKSIEKSRLPNPGKPKKIRYQSTSNFYPIPVTTKYPKENRP